MHTTIIQEAQDFVTKKFRQKGSENLAYHNIGHTRQVAAAAEEIASHSDVPAHQKELLILAAWFHDLGYTVQSEDHEEIGCKMAREFLEERDYSPVDIRSICECIMATKMPQNPKNKLQRILCDADMLHLADVAYMEIQGRLRNELEGRYKWNITDEEWLDKNQDFLDHHSFFTDYAHDNYAEGVKRSMELVKSELQRKLRDRNT